MGEDNGEAWEGEGIEEGKAYALRVNAKSANGEGIGRIGNLVVFVKNAKTRIGNSYRVRITKLYKTFAYADVDKEKSIFIGSGTVLEL